MFRKNIFNAKYTVCGIGAQTHGSYGTCVVLDYAGGYTRKGDLSKLKDNTNINYKSELDNDFFNKKIPDGNFCLSL
jgi:hypothetical protein